MIEGVVEGGPNVQTEELTLREKRIWFVRSLADLIRWAHRQGFDLTFDEGMIETPRRVRDREERGVRIYPDAQFPPRSYHYLGLAQDLFLYRDGESIMDPSHPCWHLIAEHWESMHPLCTSGVRRMGGAAPMLDRYANRLCNAGIRHVSFGEGTKVYPLPWMRSDRS